MLGFGLKALPSPVPKGQFVLNGELRMRALGKPSKPSAEGRQAQDQTLSNQGSDCGLPGWPRMAEAGPKPGALRPRNGGPHSPGPTCFSVKFSSGKRLP